MLTRPEDSLLRAAIVAVVLSDSGSSVDRDDGFVSSTLSGKTINVKAGGKKV
jgi:hypothetical protein